MFITTNDGKSYKACYDVYCGQAWDFLAYARVVPPGRLPIIEPKLSGLGLKAG
jgi:hypothetical protein